MVDKSFFDNISSTDYITLENTRDNHESLFTIMIYNTSKEIFLKDISINKTLSIEIEKTSTETDATSYEHMDVTID